MVWSVVGATVLGLTLCTAPPQADAPSDGARVLRIGTKVVPPFAEKDADGRWHGISVELWREVAAELGLRYELEERDLAGLLAGLRDGSLDASIAALTVTSEREATIDFSHPFHTSGLGIAVLQHDASPVQAALDVLFSASLLKLIALVAAVQLLMGAAVYFAERRTNPTFGGSTVRGVAIGYWWSVVTMTTVGYGDKTPITPAGRILALGWMLCSLVIISTFTGMVASTMTVQQLESKIRGPGDLPKVHVGTVAGTTSETYLRAVRINYRTFATAEAGLVALEEAAIEALVYDAPLLRAAAKAKPDTVEVLAITFERQDYAIGLPEGSPLREQVNRVLPDKLRRTPADGH